MKKLSLLWIVFLTILSIKIFAEDDPTLWNSSVDAGVQILPDYNEQGDTKGFTKTRPFVDINFDSRWSVDKDDMNSSVWNYGINIKLLGTASDNNRSTPTTFDNVSNTVDISAYLQLVPWCLRFGYTRGVYSEVGFISHIGARSRDHKSDTNDTVDTYADIGLKYSYFDTNPYIHCGIADQLPTFYIGAYYRKYNNYNNFKNPYRTIIEFKYLISSKTNFYIGAETNIGDYQNEMYLTVTYRFGIDKIADLFALKPPETVTPPQ